MKAKSDNMLLVMDGEPRVENPRNYNDEVIRDLRSLLAAGVVARRDPRRNNFYEVEDGGSTFYIHISPVNGNAMLVARWLNEPQTSTGESAKSCIRQFA
jgi:hypothetical protein